MFYFFFHKEVKNTSMGHDPACFKDSHKKKVESIVKTTILYANLVIGSRFCSYRCATSKVPSGRFYDIEAKGMGGPERTRDHEDRTIQAAEQLEQNESVWGVTETGMGPCSASGCRNRPC